MVKTHVTYPHEITWNMTSEFGADSIRTTLTAGRKYLATVTTKTTAHSDTQKQQGSSANKSDWTFKLG